MILLPALIVFVIFFYCIWSANTPKCTKCGRRGEGEEVKSGYNRAYKCPRCGRIRRESGLDY